jgi:hypothetical protein
MACDLTTVRANLAEFRNVSLNKGWIPTIFRSVPTTSFAFVHIDVDLYEPTKDSIEFFYPLMNPGGVIVCDDYGFTTCPGATKAIEEYLSDKDEKMMSLASGGGFLLKKCRTAPAPGW